MFCQALQSSTSDDNTAELALDDNPITCQLTGVEKGAWWKVDVDEIVTVAGVLIRGEMLNSHSHCKYAAFKDFNIS